MSLASSGFVPHDDSVTVIAGQPKTLTAADLRANDSEVGSGAKQIEFLTRPQNVRTESLPDGSLVVTPEFGFFGEVTFQYRLVSGQEDSQPATVRLSVIADH